jgi:hypothetical protein
MVSLTRAFAGNPVSENSQVDPSFPEFPGTTVTFGPDAGGAGGFVLGGAVGAVVAAAGVWLTGAALAGALATARADAGADAAGSADGVPTDAPTSQAPRAVARIASATKRGCMGRSVRAGPWVPGRGTFAGMATADERVLERVRAHCLALPEVEERLSHGRPTFFVAKKHFVQHWVDHLGDGRVALWCAAPVGMQPMRVHGDPERFFVPPYVGHRGWLGVRLDRRLPWAEIAGVIEDAYATIAPRRSLAKAGL